MAQRLSDWFPEALRTVGPRPPLAPEGTPAEQAAAQKAVQSWKDRMARRRRCLRDAAEAPSDPEQAQAVAAAIRSVPDDVALGWATVARAWLAHADPLSPVCVALIERTPTSAAEARALRAVARRRLRALLLRWLEDPTDDALHGLGVPTGGPGAPPPEAHAEILRRVGRIWGWPDAAAAVDRSPQEALPPLHQAIEDRNRRDPAWLQTAMAELSRPSTAPRRDGYVAFLLRIGRERSLRVALTDRAASAEATVPAEVQDLEGWAWLFAEGLAWAQAVLSPWFPEDLRTFPPEPQPAPEGDLEERVASRVEQSWKDRMARRRTLLRDAAKNSSETEEAQAVAAAIRSVPDDVALGWATVAQAWLAHAEPLSPVCIALFERTPQNGSERDAYHALMVQRLNTLCQGRLPSTVPDALAKLARNPARSDTLTLNQFDSLLRTIGRIWGRPGPQPAEDPWQAEHAVLVDRDTLGTLLRDPAWQAAQFGLEACAVLMPDAASGNRTAEEEQRIAAAIRAVPADLQIPWDTIAQRCLTTYRSSSPIWAALTEKPPRNPRERDAFQALRAARVRSILQHPTEVLSPRDAERIADEIPRMNDNVELGWDRIAEAWCAHPDPCSPVCVALFERTPRNHAERIAFQALAIRRIRAHLHLAAPEPEADGPVALGSGPDPAEDERWEDVIGLLRGIARVWGAPNPAPPASSASSEAEPVLDRATFEDLRGDPAWRRVGRGLRFWKTLFPNTVQGLLDGDEAVRIAQAIRVVPDDLHLPWATIAKACRGHGDALSPIHIALFQRTPQHEDERLAFRTLAVRRARGLLFRWLDDPTDAAPAVVPTPSTEGDHRSRGTTIRVLQGIWTVWGRHRTKDSLTSEPALPLLHRQKGERILDDCCWLDDEIRAAGWRLLIPSGNGGPLEAGEAQQVADAIRSLPDDVDLDWSTVTGEWQAHADPLSPVCLALIARTPTDDDDAKALRNIARRRLRALLLRWLEDPTDDALDAVRATPVFHPDSGEIPGPARPLHAEPQAARLLESNLRRIHSLWQTRALDSRGRPREPIAWAPLQRAIRKRARSDWSWLEPILDAVVAPGTTAERRVELHDLVTGRLGGVDGLDAPTARSLEIAVGGILKQRAEPRIAAATRLREAEDAPDTDMLRAWASILKPGLGEALNGLARTTVPAALRKAVHEALLDARLSSPPDAGVQTQIDAALRLVLRDRSLCDPEIPPQAFATRFHAALGLGEEHLAHVGCGRSVPLWREPIPGTLLATVLRAFVGGVLDEHGAAGARWTALGLCELEPGLAERLPLRSWYELVEASVAPGEDVPSAEPQPEPDRDLWISLAWLRLRLQPDLACPHRTFKKANVREAQACQRVGAGLQAYLQHPDPLREGGGPGWLMRLQQTEARRLELDFGKATGDAAAPNQREDIARDILTFQLRRWAPWCDIGRGQPVVLQPSKNGRTARFFLRPTGSAVPATPAACEVFSVPTPPATGGRTTPKAAVQATLARRYGAYPLCEPARRFLEEHQDKNGVDQSRAIQLDRFDRYKEGKKLGRHNKTPQWGSLNWDRAIRTLLANDAAFQQGARDLAQLKVAAELLAEKLEVGDKNPVLHTPIESQELTLATEPEPGAHDTEEKLYRRARMWTALLLRPEGVSDKAWVKPENAFWLLIKQWASLQDSVSSRSMPAKNTTEKVLTHQDYEILDRKLLAVLPEPFREAALGVTDKTTKKPRAERARLKDVVQAIIRSGEDAEAHARLRQVFDPAWRPDERDKQRTRIPEKLDNRVNMARENELLPWFLPLDIADSLDLTVPPDGGGTIPAGVSSTGRTGWREDVVAKAWTWAKDAERRAGRADQLPRPPQSRGHLLRHIHAGMRRRQAHLEADLRVYRALAAAYQDVEDKQRPNLPAKESSSWPDRIREQIEGAPALPALSEDARTQMAGAIRRLVERGLFTQWPEYAKAAADRLEQDGLNAARADLLWLLREIDLGDEDRARRGRLRAAALEAVGSAPPRGLGWLTWAAKPRDLPSPTLRDLGSAAKCVGRAIRDRHNTLDAEPVQAWNAHTDDQRRKRPLPEGTVLAMLLGADELSAAATCIRAAQLATDPANAAADRMWSDLGALLAKTKQLVTRNYFDRDHLRRLARARLRTSRPVGEEVWDTARPTHDIWSAPPHGDDPMHAIWRTLSELEDLEDRKTAGRPPKWQPWSISKPSFFSVEAVVHRADDGIPPLLPGGERLGDRLWLRRTAMGGAWLVTDAREPQWEARRGGTRVRWRALPEGPMALELSPGEWQLTLPRLWAPQEVLLSLRPETAAAFTAPS